MYQVALVETKHQATQGETNLLLKYADVSAAQKVTVSLFSSEL